MLYGSLEVAMKQYHIFMETMRSTLVLVRQASKYLYNYAVIMYLWLIIYIYQLGTGRCTQKAEPVGGVYS